MHAHWIMWKVYSTISVCERSVYDFHDAQKGSVWPLGVGRMGNEHDSFVGGFSGRSSIEGIFHSLDKKRFAQWESFRIIQINKNAVVGVQTRCHRRTLTSPSRGELWRRTIVAGRTCENLTTKLIRQCDDSMLNKNPKFFGDSPLRSSLWCRSRRFVYCYLSHAQGGSLTPTRSLILNHPHLFASDYSRGFLCYCTHTGTAPEEGKKITTSTCSSCSPLMFT